MLKLTKKADYGLIAMKHLAEHAHGDALSAKDLAAAHAIPTELLAKILQRLVRAGLLSSQQGINGGYTLARDPRAITTFEVIRAIEGPLFVTGCMTHRGECEQTNRCTVREPLRKVSQSIEEVLTKMTIWDLVGAADTRSSTPEQLVTLTNQEWRRQ